jgi:outer membrane protein assembly factor BamD (BamD/ComL family)
MTPRLLLALALAVLGNQFARAADRAALVREAIIYLSPDTASAKLGNVERGRELILLDARSDWLHVEALFGEEKTVTGWVLDKGAVRSTNPLGDRILYGEAVNSEDEGSRRHGRKGAAEDARRLYYRVYDYFPNSPIAGEALYRAADIQWQIERADVMSRPSAREKDSFLREGIDEQWMKMVMKKYPGSKWADLAAFHLIDNKLCGDWQGASKCPDKEAEQYEKYVKEHPQSPAAPEALYNAATRRAALIEIYKTEEQSKKSDESKNRAIALTQQLVSQYSQSDWSNRGQALLFLLQQGVPTYGNAVQ